MLEKLALISIIFSGSLYVIKNFIRVYNDYKFKKVKKELAEELQKMFESLSSVPTEIKRTKKKGK